MSWFDRFLSRATLQFLLLGIGAVIVLPSLIQIAAVGFLRTSFDLSQYPVWVKVLLGFLGIVYLVLEFSLLLKVSKNKKGEKKV